VRRRGSKKRNDNEEEGDEEKKMKRRIRLTQLQVSSRKWAVEGRSLTIERKERRKITAAQGGDQPPDRSKLKANL